MSAFYLLGLMGKLRLGARKEEPLVALLTLKGSPMWLEMPHTQAGHPQLQGGILSLEGGRAMFGITGVGSSGHCSLSLLHPPTSFHEAGQVGPPPCPSGDHAQPSPQ